MMDTHACVSWPVGRAPVIQDEWRVEPLVSACCLLSTDKGSRLTWWGGMASAHSGDAVETDMYLNGALCCEVSIQKCTAL